MKTRIKYLFPLLIAMGIIACSGNENIDTLPSNLYPQPKSVEANPKGGYTLNSITGDTIQPLINSYGDTLVTGIPIPVKGTEINPDSVLKPKSIPLPSLDKITEINAHPNRHRIPEDLTIIPLNKDALISIPLEDIAEKDTFHYIVNSSGDTIPTGTPIPAKGKVTLAVHTKPVEAMTPRFKDNSINNTRFLDMDHGLNSSYVNSILEDQNGNIWLGTWGGVSKYNGKSFVHFTEKEGLSNNLIRSILEDNSGNIWLGTSGGGINLYNGETFTHYTEKEGLTDNNISSIVEDQNGNFWFGTNGGGVSKYDGKTFTHFTDKEGLSNNFVLSIVEDQKGNLWFGTNGGGVSMFDGHSFTHYTEKDGLSNNVVVSILEDKNGKLWFGTHGGGVTVFDGHSFTQFTKKEGLSDNFVLSICENQNGNLWIGTYSGGVNIYNGESFTHITENEGLSDNIVLTILEDRSGIVWLGTLQGGVNIYNDQTFNFITKNEGLSNNSILSVLEDRDSNIWFGTYGGGVNMYNGHTFKHFTKNEGMPSNDVSCIVEDQKGNLWFGTNGGGVSMFDGKSFKHFTKKQGLLNNYTISVLEDRNGNLWFTSYGGGINMYDGQSFTHYTEKEGLSNNRVMTLLEDQSGNLWISTWGGGVCKFDGQTFTHFTEKEGLPNNYISSIFEDQKGNLWFGSRGGGVSLFNGQTFTHFSEKEGLSNNDVRSILEDSNGDFWFGTERGLNILEIDNELGSPQVSDSKLEKIKFDFIQFDKNDGLKSMEFFYNSSYIDSKNRIWMGNAKCLTMMDNYKTSIEPPKISLNRLDINEQFIDYRNMSNNLKDEITFAAVQPFGNYPLQLELAYNKNHLTFHFVAIDWNAQQKIQYSYLMEGLNSHWSHASSEIKADFRNLPYGTYTFKVRAIGASGEWSKAFEYTFTIHPPWWHTWWARTGYGILAFLLIFGTVRWRTAKLKQRQKELEKEIAIATKEIIGQKEEIEKSHFETKQQKEIIEEAHKEITDSINYAERIQRSFLATQDLLSANLKEYFVYFNPKEAVSGDFYWAGMLANADFAISCADSTGHGVPGAIMSILNISSIEKAVEMDLVKPSEIFNETRRLIIERLKKDGSAEGGKDGMDASLVSFNQERTKMKYVAAHNPIWIIRKKELIEIKAEKMPVGKHDHDHIPFEGGEFDLQKGDIIYTMTDGYQDQFGGEKGKKFKVKPMKRMLIENSHLSMEEQYKKISEMFDHWKGNLEQVDDVCIVGIKI